MSATCTYRGSRSRSSSRRSCTSAVCAERLGQTIRELMDGGEEHLHGYGHYHEEYRLVDDVWLISYRSLTRTRVDHTPRFHDAIPTS